MTKRLCGLILVAVACTGCGGPVTKLGETGKPAPPPTTSVPPQGVIGPSASPADPEKARAAAEEFLKALLAHDVATASTRLTAALKKAVAPPFYSDEKAAGFSESGVRDWLSKQSEGLKQYEVRFAIADPRGAAAAVRVEMTGPEKKAVGSLRLLDEAGAWKVSRFQVTPGTAVQLPTDGPPDIAWARAAACDFLEALLAGSAAEASSHVSPDLKKQVAPPSFSDEKAVGYSETDTRKWLEKQVAGSSSYSLTSQKSASGSAGVFDGELTTSVGKTPFSVRVGASGLVEAFEVKR